jgi:hypothetical protein
MMIRMTQRMLSSTGTAMVLAWLAAAIAPRLAAEEVDFLGAPHAGIHIEHNQQWGDFGVNVATARTGGTGSPLRIGEKTYAKGLGHHANGEIVVDLRGRYQRFRALLGVQWQGGGRGSATFRVSVDGEVKFETGPMSDSDPARPVDVPLAGARELRLTAGDSGDGIGCDMANWVEARLVRDPRVPFFGNSTVALAGEPSPPISAAAGGFAVIAGATGPQVAVMETAGTLTVSVDRGEEVRWAVPVRNVTTPVRVMADVYVTRPGEGREAEVELSLGEGRAARTVRHGEKVVLATDPVSLGAKGEIDLTVRGVAAETGVRLANLRYALDGEEFPVPVVFPPAAETIPPPALPGLRPSLETELVQWDWRMQDGIGTPREPRTWREAIARLVDRGDRLVGHLASSGVALGETAAEWKAVRGQFDALAADETTSDAAWEDLWLRAHVLRRRIALANPLAQVGPLLFVKRVPSGFSHQLSQYGGRRARPGGGVFVLEEPGRSMRCRRLDDLPLGSPMHPDVSWDGRRVLFAFCETDPEATEWLANMDQHYHLYEMSVDGSGLRRLTDGPYDDFAPRYLPDGRILFVSTRRGGFHRCGRGPCPVYTMAVADADGSDPRVISFHETHEWDPAVLNDGRVIYTRWDYVDRHAVHYQQLWSVRPDGSDVRAFYGNNTLNPVGVWEARPIPGSRRVMATAAAHHAMTAGSIILLDVTRGIDGLEPITRLTPDALFPESEAPVQRWHATAGVPVPPEVPPEQRRWPGHCYRTPYPLSEDFFLAA